MDATIQAGFGVRIDRLFEIDRRLDAFPNWVKAVVALSLPVTGYMPETVRGGTRTVPRSGKPPRHWRSAPARTAFSIVLPQAFKQMLPPTMNLYCSMAMATSLANNRRITI